MKKAKRHFARESNGNVGKHRAAGEASRMDNRTRAEMPLPDTEARWLANLEDHWARAPAAKYGAASENECRVTWSRDSGSVQ